jgi:hypothetical protein
MAFTENYNQRSFRLRDAVFAAAVCVDDSQIFASMRRAGGDGGCKKRKPGRKPASVDGNLESPGAS